MKKTGPFSTYETNRSRVSLSRKRAKFDFPGLHRLCIGENQNVPNKQFKCKPLYLQGQHQVTLLYCQVLVVPIVLVVKATYLCECDIRDKSTMTIECSDTGGK